MAGGGVDGVALGSIGAGALLLYAAVQGKTVLGTLQALVKGQSPSSGAAAPAATIGVNTAAAGSTGSASSASSASVASGAAIGTSSPQAALADAAAAYGWNTGAEWQAVQQIETLEASFNPVAQNASGAFGLAQALGHGTAGTADPVSGRNEYGGYGVSDAVAQQANAGDAGAQAIWMMAYIKQTYGTPTAALAFHIANGYY